MGYRIGIDQVGIVGILLSYLSADPFTRGKESKYLVKRGFFLIIALLFPFITTISLSPSPSSNPVVSSLPILDSGARLLRLASRALAAISNGILALRLGPAWGEDVA